MADRRALLGAALLVPACGRRVAEPVAALRPLDFAYLTPLPLAVASLEIAAEDPPFLPGDLGPRLATSPAAAVRRMGAERLSAVGSEGSARFAVRRAALLPDRGGLVCNLACRLDVLSAAGAPVAFVEAEARATASGAEARGPAAGERLLRRAMDDLNVEFEYRLRRTLRDWLAAPGAPVGLPVPVEREELPRA